MFFFQGIPTKISDITGSMPGFTELGTCFPLEHPDPTYGTLYVRVDYLSDYPPLGNIPNHYVEQTYEESSCTDQNRNYFSYLDIPLDLFGLTYDECLPSGDVWVIYSADTCATNGHVTLTVYFDSECLGTPYVYELFDTNCVDFDDDADDDDTYDDDDDYVEVGAVSNDYCT